MVSEDPMPLLQSETLGYKRQRRSSVRLGDLDAAAASAKSPKIRILTNLSSDVNANKEALDNKREANNNKENLYDVAIGFSKLIGKVLDESKNMINDNGDKDEKKLSTEIAILEAMFEKESYGLLDLQMMMEKVKAMKGLEKMICEIMEKMTELEFEF
ncbi:hypothetical protein V6N11_010416 [Hibiscus sabdariffa]|uniref:Uncharacterized protein n=1 Tax=Hibiscus sabdariffa TaxID=183260 RepID=A0ABR2S635_9ROSI